MSQGARELSKERAMWLVTHTANQNRRLMAAAWRETARSPQSCSRHWVSRFPCSLATRAEGLRERRPAVYKSAAISSSPFVWVVLRHISLRQSGPRFVCDCRRWGQIGSKHAKQAARHVAAAQMNSGFLGQVGQESNLQPAVLEPAAVRSATFRDVHEGA